MSRITYKKGGKIDGSISWGGLLVGIGMVILGIYILVSAPSDVKPAGIVVLLFGALFSMAGCYNTNNYYDNKK